MFTKRFLAIYRVIKLSLFLQILNKKMFSTRIDNQIPVINIPVGFQKITISTLIMIEKFRQKLISVARYSPEKQLHHQIELINNLKHEFPELQLHLYGFGKRKR